MAKSKKISLKGNKTHTVRGSRRKGEPKEENIDVMLHLRYHPQSKDNHPLKNLGAHTPHKRKHLSHDEFVATFSADPEDIKKVETFAADHKLKVKKVEAAHRSVILEGSLKNLSLAFEVDFVNYTHHHGDFRGFEGDVAIPEELSDIVNGVFGLSNARAASPYANVSMLEADGDIDEGDGFYPSRIAELYNFPKGLTGEGQSIGIIQLGGGYQAKCLEQYFKKAGMAMPVIKDVLVAGAKNDPYIGEVKSPADLGAFASTAEVYGDIEVAAGVAPGAQLVVYFAPNTHVGFLLALKEAVHDDNFNSVISISWGFPESDWHDNEAITSAFNETLAEAAAKGITICAASGDSGSSDLTMSQQSPAQVDFPSSSPHVLACGGTRLHIEDGKVVKEVAWKHTVAAYKVDALEIELPVTMASGGGVSELFEPPEYQTKAGVTPVSVNPDGVAGRGVPDISATADFRSGYKVQVNEQEIVSNGTSLVAPLYAGLFARINQKLDGRVGHIHEFLYKHAESKGFVNTVSEGNNVLTLYGGYYAQEGWDACTGWGSLDGEKFLQALEECE
ncbi:MAG: S8/S53 family peptidase [bacterium]|nr:S8/S53 family peptidase [bacterium]